MVKAWKDLISKPDWRINTNYLAKISKYHDEGLEIVEEAAGDLIVKQSDEVRVGKLDPSDPYSPGEMKVFGEESKRHFDPHNAGGAIVKKVWTNPTFNQSGVDDVTTHLSRFDDGTDDILNSYTVANNNYMIDRLNQINNGQIQPTDFDKRFYTHELEEYQRFQNKGITNGVNDPDWDEIFYYNAHTASLESYNIDEAVQKLYPSTVPYPDLVGY